MNITFYKFFVLLLLVSTIHLASCSQQSQLIQSEAKPRFLKLVQGNHEQALALHKSKQYRKAIQHWYKSLNLIEEYNREYSIQSNYNESFQDHKAGALCNIANSYYLIAKASDNNFNMFKDSLQNYLLCLETNPTNFRTYDDAISVAILLHDVSRTNKLKEWKQFSIDIQNKYDLMVKKIELDHAAEKIDKQQLIRDYLALNKWAYKEAKQKGVAILAEKFRKLIKYYESISI